MVTKRDINIYKQIGEKIRKLRLMKGMSQKELARYVGVTYQQIQNYEKGKSKIPVDRLIEIAKAFEVSLDYFLKEFDNSHARVSDSEVAVLTSYFKAIQSEKLRQQIISLLHTLAAECSA
jgi:transcriptional regulator with XRE-family HTH domain